MKSKLTARQEQILEFVKLYLAKYGFPPTRNEIAQGFEFKSGNAAEQHIRAIERKGWIRCFRGVSRGIQVLA
jgi:repressor LexA